MKRALVSLVVLASCLFGSGIAQATAPAGTSINIGVLGSPYVSPEPVVWYGPGLAFEDIYNFTVSSAAPYVSERVTNISDGNFFDISGLSMQIFSSKDGALQVSPFPGHLGAGGYYAKVSGTTSGLAGGSYVFAAAAVPEGQTWAMLGVGLGIIALRLRRRDKTARFEAV
jgi:hypothetical protein